jgi:soluble P-type ATPase
MPSWRRERSEVRDRRETGTILAGIPGTHGLRLRHLVLDFNGTLARDGVLIPGVRARLRRLSRQLDVSVLTADTFGTARSALRGLPLRVETVRTGADKRRLVARREGVVAIGNGRNDTRMMRAAALRLSVLGPEGCSVELLRAADIVARDINEALDLLLQPRRLTATLRR